jgi:cell wall-associated NlpC family hydrolase
MNERSRAVGAVILTVAVAGFSSGCGGQEAQQAAARVAEPVPTQAKANVKARDNAEADQSFASPAGVKLTKRAPSPAAAKSAARRAAAKAGRETEANFISPGAPSDEQIAAELRQMEAVQRKQTKAQGNGHGIKLERDGTATVAPGVPDVVARVVAGANAIAKFPYVYGGGHGSFVDTAYDCSGSLSYALAAGGLLDRTKTSGELAKGGDPGPGKWITIYANAGHTFMYVDGLRFDTSGRGGPLGSRWQTAPRSMKGFEVRHPAGL